jgi:DNA mismatch repair ATPase MutS
VTEAGEGPLVTSREGWHFDAELCAEKLRRRFEINSIEIFGISSDDELCVGAAGALLTYLDELQPGGSPHLARPKVERPGNFMPLDEMTRRNLELVESLRGGGTSPSMPDRLGPLWDFEDVDASEARLRAELAREESDVGRAEVLTQLARVHSLRDEFDACEGLLQQAETLGGGDELVGVRIELERGRKLRSSGDGAAAAPPRS